MIVTVFLEENGAAIGAVCCSRFKVAGISIDAVQPVGYTIGWALKGIEL